MELCKKMAPKALLGQRCFAPAHWTAFQSAAANQGGDDTANANKSDWSSFFFYETDVCNTESFHHSAAA